VILYARGSQSPDVNPTNKGLHHYFANLHDHRHMTKQESVLLLQCSYIKRACCLTTPQNSNNQLHCKMYSTRSFNYTLFSLLIFSIFLGVITSVPYSDNGSGKKYGDRCEAMEYCQGELVSCQHGTCTCFTPEDMIYDDQSHGCVVLAGRKCEINSEIWKVSVNCIEGAFCDEKGVCVCSEGSYPSFNGTCANKKSHKESCSNDPECSKALVCIGGTCSCDKRGQVYDETRQACVAVVDSECELEDEETECVPHAICRQGRCVCKQGYAKSTTGKCDLGFGSDCNSLGGKLCADIYFIKHPLHQVFDERTQECVSIVYGPCTFPKKDFFGKKKNVTGIYDIQKCIKNALCVDKGFYSECECKPGYVQTKAGTCAPGYLENCEADECDPTLFCRNNQCNCQDFLQTYDPTIKECVGLVGSRCSRDKPNCVEFASCHWHVKAFSNGLVRTFSDQHEDPLPVSPVKRLSFYGESCEVSSDCASHIGLICSNSTCLCSSGFIARLNPDKLLESKTTECVIRAGSKCGIMEPSDASQSIESEEYSSRAYKRTFTSYIWTKFKKSIPFLDGEVSNSHCVDNSRCFQGVCTCLPEYFQDYRGLCLKKRTLFQPCGDNDHCRSSEGLVCNQEKCQCKRSMVFDRVARKCYLPTGGICDAYSSDIDILCVRNSECSNDRCVCLDGFTPSSDGTCGVAYGKSCNGKEKLCSDIQLTCRSGSCQCKYPIHQIYNETLKQCLSKPDGPCEPNPLEANRNMTSFPYNCVPFAECKLSNESSAFEHSCKCKKGYAESQVGECVSSYSAPCNEDDDCDSVAQLSCINGICSCPDKMLSFDWTKRKCVGIVGARCKFIQLERLLSMRVDVPTECVENAICVENVFRLDGRCQCKSGYKHSPTYENCI
ncbi:Tenascin-X, partial [Orchesella cincta]